MLRWWNKRLERAKKEIAYASNYDYIIVNDNLKRCSGRFAQHNQGRKAEAQAKQGCALSV